MVSEIKNLIKELPFENVKKELDSLEKKLETKELNIVLVGEFNAGKSSLINSLYHINLPVNDRPETATIWEIVLGEKEEIVVYFKNNETKLASIEEIKELNPKDIAYIKYFINSKEDEVVLVDTPGLSSLDEFHKEALKNYIEKADVILVILDIAQGLTQSTISFLEENKENTQKLYAILTKADTLPENEQEKQLSYIKDKQLFDTFKRNLVGIFFNKKQKSPKGLSPNGDLKFNLFLNKKARYGEYAKSCK
jgi:GTP-binding protein EngB required for normal cell division